MRLLEPLAGKDLEQSKEDENPPAHDLARVYNNLGLLLSDQESFERAIRIQTDLIKKSPENWEYKVELATFYNNLSFLAWGKNEKELAAQSNHQALDGIEELLTPVPALESQRAQAHMLHLAMGPSQHPELHVPYMHLGDEYVRLATEYFNTGFPDAARLAIAALGDVLPNVAEPDRARLAKSYQDLQKQLQESMNKRKQ